MNKDALIYYSHKYNGEYSQIIKAIQKQEKYEILNLKNVITILDKEYPKEFLSLQQKPLVLYYKGNIDLLKCEKIGIVGSRNINQNNQMNIIKIMDELNPEYVTVSGLARGVDTLVHRHTKNYRSIAILGCGIDYYYPKENKCLYQILENKGLIISEYPKNVKPLKYHFPFRNRLIVALSKFLIIPHIKKQSGTMISVDYALDLGKEVYVSSVNFLDEAFCYNNQLIKEGANILTISDLK